VCVFVLAETDEERNQCKIALSFSDVAAEIPFVIYKKHCPHTQTWIVFSDKAI